MSMLDDFDDFPQQTIQIFGLDEAYNPTTGVIESGYVLSETRDVWLFQQSAIKQIISNSVFDNIEMLLVTDVQIDSESYVYYNNYWYKLQVSDDVLLSGEVVTIGLIKTDKPPITTGELERLSLLGDNYGVI